MNSFKYLPTAIGLLSIAAAIVFAAFQYGDLKKKEIENEARYQCAQSSRYETTDGKATVWYPVKELYEQCLKEKGL